MVSPAWPSLYREPLRLLGELPRRGSCAHDLGQHYPAFVATTGSCARPSPSPVLRTMAWYLSLCRLPRAPAGRRPFPVSSRRAAASPYVQEVRRAETSAMIATSMTNQFRGCSHPLMFRLPHL